MTFAEHAAKSVSDPCVLLELDIGFFNTQWVNNGAGIWSVDAQNIYSWVDTSLLEEGFSAQEFGYIGSVQRDGLLLTKVSSVEAITDATDSFYYDPYDRKLWVCLTGYDEPSLHAITIGVIYGYSFDEFTPAGGPVPYQGRLQGAPSITIARDQTYYGVLSFGGGSIDLNNADGELDRFAEDNELYGNPVRIYVGYAELNYSDYELIFTGYIDDFDVGEMEASFSIADRRKQLSKPIQQAVTAQSPITAIKALLLEHYSFPYTSDYYDLTAFAAAETASAAYTIEYNSSILLNEKTRRPLIDYLGEIATAGKLVFWKTADDKFSATVPDLDATTSSVIFRADDILNEHRVSYRPSEVVSSVKVGYAPTWTTTQTVYLSYQDTTREQSVFTSYKTYKEHPVNTPLTATAVSVWASAFMSENSVVKGTMEITVPMAYYGSNVGTAAFVEIKRPQKTMIGTTLSQIVSKSWNLNEIPTITFGVKFL